MRCSGPPRRWSRDIRRTSYGVAPRVIFDLGDFLDDYAVDRELRNDLGLLWFVEFDAHAPRRLRALPLALDYCFTRAASPAETDWIASAGCPVRAVQNRGCDFRRTDRGAAERVASCAWNPHPRTA
jgi:poly-gamma-glutamate synthesis protein (capsule biosynthesis protein)